MSYSLSRNAARAYQIANAWGSYMHTTDPGACFYAFKLNDGRPMNEAHREECKTWTSYCLQVAKNKLHATRNNPRRQREAEGARADIVDLHWLMEWFGGCPLADVQSEAARPPKGVMQLRREALTAHLAGR